MSAITKKNLKAVKPLFANYIISNEKITLVDASEIIKNDKEIAKVFNNFFSNIVKNLKIPEYNKISDVQTLKRPCIEGHFKIQTKSKCCCNQTKM